MMIECNKIIQQHINNRIVEPVLFARDTTKVRIVFDTSARDNNGP